MSSMITDWSKRLATGAALIGTVAGAAGASAQAYAPGGHDPAYRPAAPYDAPPPPPAGYDDGSYDSAPPPGYQAGQTPPPPPGYQAEGDRVSQQAADQRYGAYVEDWSRRYCTKARSNAGAGAVIGGVFGALFGSSVAGWRDRGTGALVGGLAGAGAGAAIGGSSANATSPGCPPGYVVRRDAPEFAYGGGGGGYGDPYVYAAPGWYQPWYSYGGQWAYRPYPYHVFYYGHYGFGRGYGGYGYGRGFNRGGYGYGRWRR